MLHQVCFVGGKTSAPSFSNSDLTILELLIDQFFCSYLESFPDANFKATAHFLRYYADMIRRFGPLVKTLRFESKHQYFKALTHLTKNKKNMPVTEIKTSVYDLFTICKGLFSRLSFNTYL